MERHDRVEERDNERRTTNWAKEVYLSDEYAKYCKEFLTMISEFQCMWDVHLGGNNVAKDRIELTTENT